MQRRTRTLLPLLSAGCLLGFHAPCHSKPTAASAPPQIVDTLKIDDVWVANKVSFDLHTVGDRQFVAYYDANRMMTVAAREIGETDWQKKTLQNKLHWDSHNYVAMGIDEAGYLHVTGNMHVNPLVYFRSERPYDISSMKELNAMVGDDEDSVTYPKFFHNKDGNLLFSYRSGSCGNGNVLVNRYLPAEGRWERYLEEALFEGIEADDDRAAYHKFVRDGDGNFHFVWIWRWNPLVETSHQICYATTPNLIHWKNAAGEDITLPFRPDDERVIVDPVETKGGSHNGRVQVILAQDGTPIVGYVKYDEAGLTQCYLARPEGNGWLSKPISDWDFRWKFFGGGDEMSSGGNFNLTGVSEEGLIIVDWDTEKGDAGRYVVDPHTLDRVDTIPTFQPRSPANIRERMTTAPELSVVLHEGQGDESEEGARYVLKWEAAKKSHGRHAPEVIPEGPLSELLLLEIR